MGSIFDFNETKDVIDAVEAAVNIPYSPAHELYDRQDAARLSKLCDEYGQHDPLWILAKMADNLDSKLIDDYYIVSNATYHKYLSDGIEDIDEYFEFKEDNDNSPENLIRWNKRIVGEMQKASSDTTSGRFLGLLFFQSVLADELYMAIKNEQSS